MSKESTQAPLKTAPRAPKYLSAAEKRHWERVWEVVLPLGTASAADVLAIEQVARAGARIEEAWKDADTKPSTLVAMLRLQKELLREFGLTPASRRGVRRLHDIDGEEDDPLDD